MTFLVDCHFWKPILFFLFVKKLVFQMLNVKLIWNDILISELFCQVTSIIFFFSEMIYYFNYMIMLKVLIFSKYFNFIFINILDKVFLKFFISKALLNLKIFIITKAYFMRLISESSLIFFSWSQMNFNRNWMSLWGQITLVIFILLFFNRLVL